MEVESNTIFLDAGQHGVIYQSLQMPTEVPPTTLLQVKSDLYKKDLNAPYSSPTPEATNTANIPNPSTTLGMPPLPPPLPNFPIPPMIPGGRAYAAYEYPQQYQMAPPTYPTPPAIPFMAPRYYPMQPFYYPQPIPPGITIHPPSRNNKYKAGRPIMISASGFYPGEQVIFQLYVGRSLLGIVRLSTQLHRVVSQAMYNGSTYPVWIQLPKAKYKTLNIVAIGTHSNKKEVTSIELD